MALHSCTSFPCTICGKDHETGVHTLYISTPRDPLDVPPFMFDVTYTGRTVRPEHIIDRCDPELMYSLASMALARLSPDERRRVMEHFLRKDKAYGF